VIGGNLNSRNRRRQGYVGQEKAQEAQKITANGHEYTPIKSHTKARSRRESGNSREKAQKAQNEPQIDADLRRSGEGKVKSEK
jgi:hypothetical protein